MNNISFSIAMAVYEKDNACYFDRALQSITELQTLKPDEIVLVCDGPLNDELDEVIEKYQKLYPILNVIRLSENAGLGNALKLAVEESSYEYIARMDSDDVSVSDRFEQQVTFFQQHPELDVVGGDITEFIGEESNIVGKRKVPVSDSEIKQYMKRRCAFNHVSVMYKKSSILAVGGYMDWFWNEDYYLWIRMQLGGSIFANTGTVLVNVRVGEAMYKRRGGKKYFESEFRLQRLMLQEKMVSVPIFLENIGKRFVVQRLLPNRVRGWVFKKFART